MSDYGIKIAIPGRNVLTGGLKDLLLHSKYPMLKIKAMGSGSVTYTDGGAGFDVLLNTHSLGYQPQFAVFSQWYDSLANTLNTTYRKMPITVRNASGSQAFNFIPVISTTALRFQGSSFGGSGTSKTLNYIWIIYYDEL